MLFTDENLGVEIQESTTHKNGVVTFYLQKEVLSTRQHLSGKTVSWRAGEKNPCHWHSQVLRKFQAKHQFSSFPTLATLPGGMMSVRALCELI